MRCFLGVFPPPEIRQSIHDAMVELPDLGLRWTSAENLHLTLHFLGEVDESAMAELAAAAERAAAAVPVFDCRLQGLGSFPLRGRPRVLFLDLQEGARALRRIHDEVYRNLPDRLRPERSSFRPHLTVARPKGHLSAADRQDLAADLAARSWDFPAVTVDLVRSELHPEGARYRLLHAASLPRG